MSGLQITPIRACYVENNKNICQGEEAQPTIFSVFKRSASNWSFRAASCAAACDIAAHTNCLATFASAVLQFSPKLTTARASTSIQLQAHCYTFHIPHDAGRQKGFAFAPVEDVCNKGRGKRAGVAKVKAFYMSTPVTRSSGHTRTSRIIGSLYRRARSTTSKSYNTIRDQLCSDLRCTLPLRKLISPYHS